MCPYVKLDAEQQLDGLDDPLSLVRHMREVLVMHSPTLAGARYGCAFQLYVLGGPSFLRVECQSRCVFTLSYTLSYTLPYTIPAASSHQTRFGPSESREVNGIMRHPCPGPALVMIQLNMKPEWSNDQLYTTRYGHIHQTVWMIPWPGPGSRLRKVQEAGPDTSPLPPAQLKQLCTRIHSNHPSYTL